MMRLKQVQLPALVTPTNMLIVALGFAFSAGANVTLMRTVRHVAETFREYKSDMESRPRPGMILPPVAGTDVNGQPIQLAYDDADRLTLLFVFSPTCGYCNKNWPNWTDLMTEIPRDKVRVAAIDLSGRSDAEFREAHALASIPLFLSIDYATSAAYNFHLVPTTMLIRPDGSLERTWAGVLDQAELTEVRTALNTPLGANTRGN